jgi:hypothetical protein
VERVAEDERLFGVAEGGVEAVQSLLVAAPGLDEPLDVLAALDDPQEQFVGRAGFVAVESEFARDERHEHGVVEGNVSPSGSR